MEVHTKKRWNAEKRYRISGKDLLSVPALELATRLWGLVTGASHLPKAESPMGTSEKSESRSGRGSPRLRFRSGWK